MHAKLPIESEAKLTTGIHFSSVAYVVMLVLLAMVDALKLVIYRGREGKREERGGEGKREERRERGRRGGKEGGEE